MTPEKIAGPIFFSTDNVVEAVLSAGGEIRLTPLAENLFTQGKWANAQIYINGQEFGRLLPSISTNDKNLVIGARVQYYSADDADITTMASALKSFILPIDAFPAGLSLKALGMVRQNAARVDCQTLLANNKGPPSPTEVLQKSG